MCVCVCWGSNTHPVVHRAYCWLCTHRLLQTLCSGITSDRDWGTIWDSGDKIRISHVQCKCPAHCLMSLVSLHAWGSKMAQLMALEPVPPGSNATLVPHLFIPQSCLSNEKKKSVSTPYTGHAVWIRGSTKVCKPLSNNWASRVFTSSIPLFCLFLKFLTFF